MGSLFDVAFVGGGIAGLASAELFARSGCRVVLIEKNAKLCQETSGAHHEWFHFGSLYSIFPTNRFLRTLVGGIEDLLEYYSGFGGMNLRIDRHGKLETFTVRDPWLRDETIDYIVAARNDNDFKLKEARGFKETAYSLGARLSWDLLIKRFICRHTRFHRYDWRLQRASAYIPNASWFDYSREYISKFADADINLDPNTHFQIPSYDRPMNASNIVQDLTRGLLAAGGCLRLDTELQSYTVQNGTATLRLGNGESIESKHVVLAMGTALRELTTKLKIKTVAAPLAVVYPAVCDRNIVRLTPFVERTINHLKHTVDGCAYSLIGGGYFADPGDQAKKDSIEQQLLSRAHNAFPRMKDSALQEVYFSYKTELAPSLETRNYLYRIEQIDPVTYVVVPGKFSLCFSLAVNTYQKLLGAKPATSVRYDKEVDVAAYVDLMLHKQIVRRQIQHDNHFSGQRVSAATQ